MLTETTLRVISIVFGNCCFIKCVPFDWNRKTREISPISGRRIYLYYFTVLYTLSNAVFLIGSFVHSKWTNQKRSLLSTVFHLVFCGAFSAATIFHFNNAYRKNQLSEFINQMFKLLERLKRSFKRNEIVLKRDMCERAILALSCLAYVDCFLISMLFLDQRTDVRYIYAHFQFQEDHPILLPIFWFLALWDAVIVWHVVVFNMINVLSYLFSTILWLTEINYLEGCQLCKSYLKTPNAAFYVYRCLQVLNQNFNSCFGPIVLPLSLIALLTSILGCNVLSIKFQDQIPMPTLGVIPLVSLYCMAVVRTVFPTGAALHILSIKFLRSWRNNTEDRRNFIFLQGCRPLRMEICPFFFIKRGTTLRVLRFATFYTANILLIFKKSDISLIF